MSKLFFAIIPPSSELEMIQEKTLPVLRSHSDSWRIANPEQWHITLQYVGEANPIETIKIIQAFEKIKLPRAEEIMVGGTPSMGLLVQHESGPVLYVRIAEKHPFLLETRRIVRSIVDVSDRETTTFHLTVARAKRKEKMFSSIVSAIPPFTSTFLPLGVTLFRSEEQNGKTVHIPLSTRAFSL
ncbi:MAG: hypothetical protein AABX02_02580 [archaeon]